MPKKSQIVPGFSLVEKELSLVEELLLAEARSEVRLVIEVSSHILGSGGKRFRPLLTLLAGRLVGFRRRRELIAYAAAMEFAHTSTLLHDDVIDEADRRRGERSANRRFGNAASIIVGDYVLFKGFNLIIRGRDLEVLKLISRVSIEMAEGEAYQLSLKQKPDLTEKQYERIIRAKTALLICAACEVPALAARAGADQRKALADYGHRLGLAFQIADDLLDYTASDREWGKQVGKDFLEGKVTLPLIVAYRRADEKERALIKALLQKPRRDRSDFNALMKILEKRDAFNRTLDRARSQAEKAKRSLARFPDRPAKKALLELADFVVDRTR